MPKFEKDILKQIIVKISIYWIHICLLFVKNTTFKKIYIKNLFIIYLGEKKEIMLEIS
jgi:hypothetical protein